MTFALALLVAIASQTATVEASDGADSYLGFLDVQVIVEKHDGTQARGKLVALSPTTITVRLKDLRLLEVPRTEVSTVTAEAGPTAPPEPALAPVEVKKPQPSRPVVDTDDDDRPKTSRRKFRESRSSSAPRPDQSAILEQQANELSDEAFRFLLGGGVGVAAGVIGLAVGLWLPLNIIGLGCIGASCLAIMTGAVVAGIGAVKNTDAAEKRRIAARLRGDPMAY